MAPLVRAVAPIIGGTYILVGDAELVSSVTASVADLRPRNQFGWMDLDTIPTRRDHCHDHRAVGWLHGTQWPAVRDLLDGAFPDSYARPGAPGVRRWAGAYDDAGSLVATAADAWSAPTLGFLAGVCVHASARHRGLGRAVCRFVLADLVATHGRAGLMVHTWNTAAIRTYRDLGLSWRLLGTAWIGGDGSSGTPTPGGGQGHDC